MVNSLDTSFDLPLAEIEADYYRLTIPLLWANVEINIMKWMGKKSLKLFASLHRPQKIAAPPSCSYLISQTLIIGWSPLSPHEHCSCAILVQCPTCHRKQYDTV
jgi:hypothetical protein